MVSGYDESNPRIFRQSNFRALIFKNIDISSSYGKNNDYFDMFLKLQHMDILCMFIVSTSFCEVVSLFFSSPSIWMFPKIGVPQKWMVYFMENPIKMDDLGGNTPIFGNTHVYND